MSSSEESRPPNSSLTANAVRESFAAADWESFVKGEGEANGANAKHAHRGYTDTVPAGISPELGGGRAYGNVSD